MKKLILLLLISINIYANDSIRESKNITYKQYEQIVKNGWNDSNKTLNTHIIKSVKHDVPRILKKLHNPFSVKRDVATGRSTPKLFSYVKLLEYKGEEDKAYKIYIDALKGSNNREVAK